MIQVLFNYKKILLNLSTVVNVVIDCFFNWDKNGMDIGNNDMNA